jgi:hypothetical protein
MPYQGDIPNSRRLPPRSSTRNFLIVNRHLQHQTVIVAAARVGRRGDSAADRPTAGINAYDPYTLSD